MSTQDKTGAHGSFATEWLEPRILFAGSPFPTDRGAVQTPDPDGRELVQATRFLRVVDASGDNTPLTAFEGGALRVSFRLPRLRLPGQTIRLVATDGVSTETLKTYGAVSEVLNDLVSAPGLEGDVQFRVEAFSGARAVHSYSGRSAYLRMLNTARLSDGVGGSTLVAPGGSPATHVVAGGGTDTLRLDVPRTGVSSLNGGTLAAFSPQDSTASQAIYCGYAHDFIMLADGREIYLRGVERIQFSDGSTQELVLRPNDTSYASQWNLHATDVPGAWRFSTGSTGVMLVSLDSGVLNPSGAPAGSGVWDTTLSRLITDSTDDDNLSGTSFGHGHMSISVMSASSNNGTRIAGINWSSNVWVADVYSGQSFYTAIRDAVTYAQANGLRVVFQGGVQGEYWLQTGGHTQQQLEALIAAHSENALFAIAAGNGGIDMNVTTDDPQTSLVEPAYSAGVARLASNHGNIMSVGAAQNLGSVNVNGLANTSQLSRAGYSNFGSALTMLAPTDSPAVTKFNQVTTFTGTSCANPNLAGVASLVWSVYPQATASMIRGILTQTATDMHSPGRDDLTGAGLVNADAAARRAWALLHDPPLALLELPSAQVPQSAGVELTSLDTMNSPDAVLPILPDTALAAPPDAPAPDSAPSKRPAPFASIFASQRLIQSVGVSSANDMTPDPVL
jgi:hypothetical protein